MKRFVSIILAALMLVSLSACAGTQTDEEEISLESLGLDPELFSDYDYSKFKGQEITLNVAN